MKKKPRVTAIVQARLGSSRLPLKSLLCLRGLPVVDWAARRLQRAKELDDVVFAIPDTPLDTVLYEHLRRGGLACARGPENDVLARFRQAAEAYGADLIVRVCADNPLVAPEAVDALVRFYMESGADYAYNHIPRGCLWPDGLGAEIVSRELLERVDSLAKKPFQREHCFNYIWDNPEQWRISAFDPGEEWLRRPDIKLDIDTAADFQKLALLSLSPEMGLEEIIKAWDNAPSDC